MKRQLQLTILLISALTLTFTSAPVAAVTLEARHRKRQHDYDGDSAIDADEQHHGPKQLNSKKSKTDKSDGKSKSSKKATYLAVNTPNPTPTPPPAEELTKLLPDDGARGDKFGYAVSLSGNTLAVGSFLDDDKGSSSGSVYVFVQDGDTWKQQSKILPDDGTAIDNFGSAVSLNGDTLAVGAPGDATRGSAYVFVRDGDTWEQQSKLLPNDGGEVLGMFGSAVSLSGNTLAVGAWGEGAFTDSGSVYIFVRDGETWEQEAKILPNDEVWFDRFGYAVSLSGNTLAVGTDNASGSAYVFVRDVDTWEWEQQAKLLPDDVAAGDNFGSAVSLSDNALAVGAWGNDEDSGSVYVFIRDGDTDLWKQQAKLLPNDGAASDKFGYAVSLSGNTLAVGSFLDDDNGSSSGSAYVFVRSGDLWKQEAKILPNDGTAGDEFGFAVSLSGNAVVIGAVGDDDKGSNSGSAYVFPLV